MKTKEKPGKPGNPNQNTHKDKLNSLFFKGLLWIYCLFVIYELIIVKL